MSFGCQLAPNVNGTGTAYPVGGVTVASMSKNEIVTELTLGLTHVNDSEIEIASEAVRVNVATSGRRPDRRNGGGQVPTGSGRAKIVS